MTLLQPRNPGFLAAVQRFLRHRRRRTLLVTLAVLSAVALVAFGVSAGIALRRGLPDVSAVFNPPAETTRIYARDGRLVASLYRENRTSLPLSEIPLIMQHAVIAIEDDRFYQHHGVDLRGTVRAVWRNLLARQIVEGGSTITQQLARNLFLTQKREISRKLAEMILALEVERRLTKQEILERYLNQVYFGHGAHGVGLAAHVYFDKPATDLNLAESALLAGVIRAPSIYSLYQNFALAKERQVVVLRRMAALGYLTNEQAQAAVVQPIRLAEERNVGLVGIRAPYFVSYILPYLLERYGENQVYNGGLRVYTTLDFDMQAAAEVAIREGIDGARKQNLSVTQGALVAIEPRTGHIRAIVGGYDFSESQFNRAWQARRQPGSSFKPFIYLTALASGMPPTKIIDDAPVEYTVPGPEPLWQPKNYDEKFRGPVSMRYALEHSINIPAIKTLAELGPAQVIPYAKRMGITSPLEPNLSLALGTNDVTPLELASAYGTLAALGVRAEPIAIKTVLDRSGQVLEEREPRQELALSAEIAYVMTDLLKGVMTRGTGQGAAIGRPAAGKTGTTDDYRNAWFIGYTPQLVTAVWVGNDDNSPMNEVVGATVPARVWAAFMKVATKDLPPDDWVIPPGVTVVTVCGETGLLATNDCKDPRSEAFIEGTAPVEYARGTGEPPGRAAVPGATAGGGRPTPPPHSSLPLIVTAPADGAVVSSPFMIEGTTTPGTKVTITITLREGLQEVQVERYVTAARRDGRFKYEFHPSRLVPGAQYAITVTASLRTGESQTAAITVSEPAAPENIEPKE
ncbi:MAG: PBP1A family penicillin-binding protein [Armatimonadetes bacterium]|nr:PBP1A family penicillin-binding protein [Armatimonadota bacterium]